MLDFEQRLALLLLAPASSRALVNTMQPGLIIIFKHTPKRSDAKVIKDTDPIPDGWAVGGGRLNCDAPWEEKMKWTHLDIERPGREARLTAWLYPIVEGAEAYLENLGPGECPGSSVLELTPDAEGVFDA